MSDIILCIAAFDGMSSNHIMNSNLIKAFLAESYDLYGIVINNYREQNDCNAFCKKVFKKWICINGLSFEYKKSFFLKEFFRNKTWLKKVLNQNDLEIRCLIEDITFKRIVSFASPIHSHIIAYELINAYSPRYEKYVQFWSDPICGSMLKGKAKIPLKRWIISKVEKSCISHCDYNVYGTKPLADYQRTLYPKYSDLIFWSDIPCLPDGEQEENISDKNQKCKIGFFGVYQPSIRNLSPLVSACSEMSSKVDLVVCGDGIISKHNMIGDNCTIINKRIPYDKSHYMELNCDVLVSVGNLSGCQIPGKTLYYAGTHKPIIFIADGDFADEHKSYLEGFNRYILCNNEREEIIEAINNAMNMITNNVLFEIPTRMQPQSVIKRVLCD